MSSAFTKERDDAPEPVISVPHHQVERGELAPPDDLRTVGFGATVVVEGATPKPRPFTIVAPDENDIAAGRLGLDSPLARAMYGAQAGDEVTWHRPIGDAVVRIVSVKYDSAAERPAA